MHFRTLLASCSLGLLAAWGGTLAQAQPLEQAINLPAATTSAIKYVFVVTMENHDASQIYGNNTNAP
jgi:hypothetical protein